VFLLDTDTLSFYLKPGDKHPRLRRKIVEEITNIALSIITIDEYIEGISKVVQKSRHVPDKAAEAYAGLSRFIALVKSIPVLEYDSSAQVLFDGYDPGIKNLSLREDARIAAIARANECVVVTGNKTHFDQLQVNNIDWIDR
jgi:predicted nucleic acid-binding protein